MNTTPNQTVQTRGHHQFGPSRMNSLAKCAAFTSAEASDAAVDAADRGTLLHDIMENAVKNVQSKKYQTTRESIDELIEQHAAAEITDEERGYLIFCCKKVDSVLLRNPEKILTEVNVEVKDMRGQVNHGYLDLLMVFKNVAVLVDYKFGWIGVERAEDNLQGLNYAAGVMQQRDDIKVVGVCFIQPKLGLITETLVKRDQLHEIVAKLRYTIENAILAKKLLATPADGPEQEKVLGLMHVGKQCEWCALAGTCSVLANHRAAAASALTSLPVPSAFRGLNLTSPQDLALAKFWADIIETKLGDVKKAALEAAKTNGGKISCTLPDGTEVIYEVQSRGCDRVLSSAPEIADALQEFITPAELLGAASLSIGDLEKIVRNSLPEAYKAKTGEKLTKKRAWEMTESTLSSLGLLSRPDTKIEFLKKV